MGPTCTILLVTALASAWTERLQAQDSLSAGAHVRLTIKASRISPSAPDTHTVTLRGRALAVDGNALLFERESWLDTVLLALDSVRTLEAVVGRRNPVRESAVVGGLVGAGIGAAVGAMVDKCPNGEFLCFNARPVRSRGSGAVLGALIGAGVGALTGQFIEVDRWQRIEPKRVRVASLPTSRGGTLGVTIAF